MAECWVMGKNRKNSFTLSVKSIPKKCQSNTIKEIFQQSFLQSPLVNLLSYILQNCVMFHNVSFPFPQFHCEDKHPGSKEWLQYNLPCKTTATKELYLTISNSVWAVSPAPNWWSRLHFQDAATVRLWDVTPGRNQSTCSLHMNVPPRRE